VSLGTQRSQRRKDLLALRFESMRITRGDVVAVRPRAEVAPLLGCQSSVWRTRPGLKPPVFGDIRIEGLEDLMSLVVESAEQHRGPPRPS
jgi:hypothetical protein